ncbi:MAG: CoA-binding protein [Chloroflexi bacterium]|nr:CoA-binding protein [Chloroflexota bacterium]
MPTIREQLDPLFRPRSVAIIGATSDLRRWGGWVVDRPKRTGYVGRLYPVHPREREIQGLPAYPTVGAIPDDIDLALIVVRAHLVPGIMAECVAKGVKTAIVISAGFAEVGEEGRVLQERTLAAARAGGLRFVGPNCQGIYTAAAAFNIMWPTAPQPGGVAIISQSGSFAAGLGSQLLARGLGVSVCLSIGNQADLTMADYLEYLAEDDRTRAMCLYIEGFQEGRRFYETAKALAPRKPILLFKPGRTPTGARSAQGHTASLATPDLLVDALCRQAGLLRALESDHLLDMADAVAAAGPAPGRRIAVVHNAGAQCVIISEACDALGLELPLFDAATQAHLQALLPHYASVARNPVDLGGPGPDPVMHTEVLETIAALEDIDGIIAAPLSVSSNGDTFSERDQDPLERVTSLPKRYGKPMVLSGFRGAPSDDPVLRRYREAGIPAFFAEDCARAMSALVRYGEVRRGE